jgi:hypothetical protein
MGRLRSPYDPSLVYTVIRCIYGHIRHIYGIWKSHIRFGPTLHNECFVNTVLPHNQCEVEETQLTDPNARGAAPDYETECKLVRGFFAPTLIKQASPSCILNKDKAKHN